MSFGGQKYDDSPKAVYEHMLEDPYFTSYELIWGFTDPKKYDFVKCEKIKVDTLKFYITAISSHIWITNSSIERGLHLKNKNCIEINTWHGTPLKKMGNDINNNQSYSSHSSKSQKSTIYCAQSEYDRSIFERFFNISKENILLSDLPRNDVLLKYSQNQINEIKKCSVFQA